MANPQELLMDGPIPGENYTRDTRNFPWHRPPEISDYDEAIEAALTKLTSEEGATRLLGLIAAGVDIAYLTERFVSSGIATGKWSPDFAVLLAGPVAHIMIMMAKGYDIEYDLGIKDDKNPFTKSFFSEMKKINSSKAKSVAKEVREEAPEELKEPPKTGFMQDIEEDE